MITNKNNLSVNELLRTSKALEPITESVKKELERLQTLDVSTYSEADVRAEIIDPVIKALGYQKQTSFSVVREKPLKIADGDVFIDFSVTLWESDFWVIEAKKVKRNDLKFIKAEVQQTLIYASHPDINAALMVLCDGRMFHIYDREQDLVEPLVKVDVSNLVRDFDLLRKYLSPWQAWFFQKRRLINLVDKVFDQEMSLQRLEDFRELIDHRLGSKRNAVLERQRENAKANPKDNLDALKQLPSIDLIDCHLMYSLPWAEVHVIGQTLVDRCNQDTFEILYRLFPDLPKATTSHYWGHALYFMIKLEETKKEVNWLPSYLSSDSRNLDTAIKQLIDHILTTFEKSPAHRLCQLYSASARRIAKQLVILLPHTEKLSNDNHAFALHTLNELELSQTFSSPKGYTIALIDQMQIALVEKFVKKCSKNHSRFDISIATQGLYETWAIESRLLGDGSRYRTAREARDLGELHPTECDFITYDALGHLALCIIEKMPKWKEFILSNYKFEIERHAQLGSHAARRVLGLEDTVKLNPVDMTEIANRFFLGNVNTLKTLAKGYGHFNMS